MTAPARRRWKVLLVPRVSRHRDGVPSHGIDLVAKDDRGTVDRRAQVLMRHSEIAARRDATVLAAKRGWIVVENLEDTGEIEGDA